MKALSIRQPWAWCILHAEKNIENRTWKTFYRGTVLIHAAKTYTTADKLMAKRLRLAFPIPDDDKLLFGGIIGWAEVVDCITESHSQWFDGPYGIVLKNVIPMPFIPCRGALGFFKPPLSVFREIGELGKRGEL